MRQARIASLAGDRIRLDLPTEYQAIEPKITIPMPMNCASLSPIEDARIYAHEFDREPSRSRRESYT